MNGMTSEWMDVVNSITQGIFLGPCVSAMYTNDLVSTMQNAAQIYADDIMIYGRQHGTLHVEMLQEDLTHDGVEWLSQLQLPFHARKCSILHLG